MKSLDANFQAHLESTVQNVCTCWLVTRKDGVVMGFTDHQRDLTFGGVTYKATTGFTASSILTTAGLAVDNLELEGLLSSADITEPDILRGKYDHAAIVIALVNGSNPSQVPIVQRRGTLGEVTIKNGSFYAELRGLTQLLAQNVNEVYSPDCRAKLGDARCGYNLTANGFPFNGTVSGVTSRRRFNTGFTQADGYFAWGFVTWVTGLNAGLSMEIIQYAQTGGEFVLWLPLPKNIQAGDQFQLTLGCDKKFATCASKFGNAINFRGEPFVPTGDQAMAYPNAH